MVDKQLDLNVGYVTFTPSKLHFDGSVCKDGCGVGVVIISPNGAFLRLLTPKIGTRKGLTCGPSLVIRTIWQEKSPQRIR
jgi:hypothetical protein